MSRQRSINASRPAAEKQGLPLGLGNVVPKTKDKLKVPYFLWVPLPFFFMGSPEKKKKAEKRPLKSERNSAALV